MRKPNIMRSRSVNRKAKAAETAGVESEKPPADEKPRRSRKKTSASVTAEMPPELPKEGEQQGSSDTRVSQIKMTGFENIIESTFTFNPDTVYAEVKAGLTLGTKASRADYGDLVNALDASEENARKALQLVANAKVASSNYQADVNIIRSELHEQSVREIYLRLEDQNDDTVKRKPTKDDIEAYKVSNYHDEWSDMENRVQKAKRTVDYLEGLAALCAQRARDLRQMVSGNRGA